MTASSVLLALHMLLSSSEALPTLIIYTYDSMMAKGSFGQQVIPEFEKSCKCRVKTWASGDAGQMLTRVEMDFRTKGNSADLLLGIDQNSWDRMKIYTEPWKKWRPKGFEKISPFLGAQNGFLPIDYGFFSFIADLQILREKKIPLPTKLDDLLKTEWKRNILLEDPRTSAPGLAFLLFTEASLGKDHGDFWKKLRTQWLTLASGWSAAYGLFLKGEAPLVWSYTTSEAYHRFHGDKESYGAVYLAEGAPIHIEGASILRGTSQNELAQKFLEFLIQPEIQRQIPRTQWMYPSRADTKLPKEFLHLRKPTKIVATNPSEMKAKKTLRAWGISISEAH